MHLRKKISMDQRRPTRTKTSEALAAHVRQACARYTVQIRGHCKEKRVSALTELALQVLEVQSEVEDVCSQKNSPNRSKSQISKYKAE